LKTIITNKGDTKF